MRMGEYSWTTILLGSTGARKDGEGLAGLVSSRIGCESAFSQWMNFWRYSI
jgi:hypothetical protein